MLRAIKYELKPTCSQKEQIKQACGCCRLVYNTMLDRKISTYKESGKTISEAELMRQLTELKSKKEFLKEVPSQSLQQAIRNLDTAYSNFFRKNGSGFPKFTEVASLNSKRRVFGIALGFLFLARLITKIGLSR